VLTGEQAATQLGWSSSKVSRIETGRTAVSPEDLDRLLDFYQVVGARRDRLTELSQNAGRRGWWDVYADILSSGYCAMIPLEDAAESEWHFSPAVIPGLLQTGRYAHEVTRVTMLDASPGQIGRLTEVRMTRQQLLAKDPPLNLAAILDESALRRVVGDTEVMRAQLSHLIEVGSRPNITIQVLPFSEGPHLAMSGTFTILNSPIAPAVAYLENMAGDLIIEDETEVHGYVRAFEQARGLAHGAEASSALITQIADDFR
jgi:transcriptional regulator with XRE-family HTH domain